MTTNSKRWSLAGILTACAALMVGPVMVTHAATEYLAIGGERSMYTMPDGTVYGIHEFKNVGVTNFTPTGAKLPLTVEYLVIAGGGGGGLCNWGGGGGGAGGYRSSVKGEKSGGNSAAEAPISLTNKTPVPVTVGAGGSGASATSYYGGRGGNSSFGTVTALGGGGGGVGGAFGSGGGANYGNGPGQGGPGTGTPGQGFNGGTLDGGGGGAATNGSAGGKGGAGLTSSITCVSVARAVGGNSGRGGDGLNNTGDGGGGVGGGAGGGSGGSGVVIVRYVIATGAPVDVVLDSTTVWRQFRVGGVHHVRTADSNLVPGLVDFMNGSYAPAHGGIQGRSFGPPCRHAKKDDGKAVAASPNTVFCGEMTQLPPSDWIGPAMDDSVWPRVLLPQPVPAAEVHANGGPIGSDNCYNIYSTVLLLARTRFEINDPAQVKACVLSLDYWGGVVVYVNGQEVARGDMPDKRPDLASPAMDYPEEAFLTPQGKVLATDDDKNMNRLALRNRQLRDVQIPAAVLRKGVNVIAVETHAAPVNARVLTGGYGSFFAGWPPVGLLNARLTVSPAGTAVTRRIQVWNCGPCDTLSVFDRGMAAEPPLRPIQISAPRNGVFSGRLVVGSDQAIKGLKVNVTDLTQAQGGKIAASAVRVRYAVVATHGTSWVGDDRFDGLFDVIPAEIPVAGSKPQAVNFYHLSRGLKPIVPGAVAPLWFTVRVPRNVPPGLYEGKVSVSADGLPVTTVPLRVEVCAWTIPDPKDFRVQNFLYHAEEVYAKYYNLTNYSDKHLEMVGQSLAILAEANSRQVEANLACDFFGPRGNPESLVRWIKQPDGSFKHDFTNLDRYLDMVVKYVGKPKPLRLNCWGAGGHNGGPGGGLEVSVFDPATGKLERMPNQFTEAFWRPVLSEVLEKVKARGLLGDTTLGYNSQYPLPDPTLVDVAHKIWPEGEWSFVAHSGRESMKFVGTDTKVAMTVRHADGVQTQPSGKLPPLWSLDQPRRNTFANGCRNEIRDTMAIRDYRRVVELGAVNRGYDGIGQIGADLFPLKKPSGGYAATGAGRGTGWAYQGTTLSLLYPGPDGPVATERFEMLREGVELCEAVLVLRRAVADKKLSSDLQQRTERYLASRDKTINQGDFVPWFIQTEEDAKLLGLAGEVALELGKK